MPGAAQVLSSLYGAWRLALFDRGGLQFFDGSREGAIHSFYAAVLCLPAYLILISMQIASFPPKVDFPHLFVIHGLVYVITWTAFPLVMHPIAGQLDRAERYFGFVSVFNWIRVLQMVVLVLMNLVIFFGILPAGATLAVTLTVWLCLLIYEWFAIRHSLNIEGTPAALLVGLEFVIDFILTIASREAIG